MSYNSRHYKGLFTNYLDKFLAFWPPTSLCLHFLPYESWHFLTTYPLVLVNIVCERPLSLTDEDEKLINFFIRCKIRPLNKMAKKSHLSESSWETKLSSCMCEFNLNVSFRLTFQNPNFSQTKFFSQIKSKISSFNLILNFWRFWVK